MGSSINTRSDDISHIRATADATRRGICSRAWHVNTRFAPRGATGTTCVTSHTWNSASTPNRAARARARSTETGDSSRPTQQSCGNARLRWNRLRPVPLPNSTTVARSSGSARTASSRCLRLHVRGAVNPVHWMWSSTSTKSTRLGSPYIRSSHDIVGALAASRVASPSYSLRTWVRVRRNGRTVRRTYRRRYAQNAARTNVRSSGDVTVTWFVRDVNRVDMRRTSTEQSPTVDAESPVRLRERTLLYVQPWDSKRGRVDFRLAEAGVTCEETFALGNDRHPGIMLGTTSTPAAGGGRLPVPSP